MADRPGGLVAGTLRHAAPLLTGIVAVCIDVLPLPNPAPSALAPFLTLCVLYFWTVYRPDLLSSWAVFALGLVLDAVGGLPLGLTALALLLGRGALLSGQRFLLAQPFMVIWACFVPMVLLVAALRWVLASLFWSRAFPIQPLLGEALLTLAVYPLVGWLLAGMQRRLAERAHATAGI